MNVGTDRCRIGEQRLEKHCAEDEIEPSRPQPGFEFSVGQMVRVARKADGRAALATVLAPTFVREDDEEEGGAVRPAPRLEPSPAPRRAPRCRRRCAPRGRDTTCASRRIWTSRARRRASRRTRRTRCAWPPRPRPARPSSSGSSCTCVAPTEASGSSRECATRGRLTWRGRGGWRTGVDTCPTAGVLVYDEADVKFACLYIFYYMCGDFPNREPVFFLAYTRTIAHTSLALISQLQTTGQLSLSLAPVHPRGLLTRR